MHIAVCALLCAVPSPAQTTSILPATPSPTRPPASSLPGKAPPQPSNLPDAPSSPALPQDVVVAAHTAFEATGDTPPVLSSDSPPVWEFNTDPGFYGRVHDKRALLFGNQRFLNTEVSIPMTSHEKAFIAATDVIDPVNLSVIALSSAIYTGVNPDSAYGAGFKGFGRNYGYSLTQDVTGEFFGTFLIPSLAHQDPRYHRMPGAPVGRRIVHALAHTVVSEHDDGSPMPNYATLLTYPIAAEIANLYVPGLQTDSASTAKRIVIGYASDPADALIGEFLPDLARRIHIRVTFFQQVINNISVDRTSGQ